MHELCAWLCACVRTCGGVGEFREDADNNASACACSMRARLCVGSRTEADDDGEDEEGVGDGDKGGDEGVDDGLERLGGGGG